MSPRCDQSKLSMRKAAKVYKISWTTIKNKLEGKHNKAVGGQKIVTEKEEDSFVTRVFSMCEWRVPLDKFDLRMMVAAYLAK